MADDVLEESGPAQEAGKVKREPPTIDLEATKIAETGAAPKATDAGAPETKTPETKAPEAKPAEARSKAEPRREPKSDSGTAIPSRSRSASPWVVAPISGVVAAALVVAAGYVLGWPAVQAPPAAPQVSAAAVDDLTGRVVTLESKTAKTPPPVTDPAVTARLDAVEKSVAALRGDVATLRTQSDKLAASVSEPKTAAPGEAAAAPAPTIDLSAINERLDKVERVSREQAAAVAGAKQAASKAQDDLPLRRVVAAALLDVAVRHGDPYVGALASAKALSPDPDKLKPLDQFAEKGVPHPPMLNRELLTLVPKLSPATENSDTGTGIVDRLKAGASGLVRVERTDAVGNDRSAIVARVTAAALRNDFVDARRELASLDAADRAPAQAWLDKVIARDAALAASRQFADDMMAALGKSAQ
jgi:hypothetical protein